jgi:hypothetical protein
MRLERGAASRLGGRTHAGGLIQVHFYVGECQIEYKHRVNVQPTRHVHRQRNQGLAQFN